MSQQSESEWRECACVFGVKITGAIYIYGWLAGWLGLADTKNPYKWSVRHIFRAYLIVV